MYALGCVAYFLLTGQLVFDGETPMKMLMQHVQSQPVAPSQRTELRIPREVDELVLACLQKDPNLRPQDAGALFRMACDCKFSNAWNQERARNLVGKASAATDRALDRGASPKHPGSPVTVH